MEHDNISLAFSGKEKLGLIYVPLDFIEPHVGTFHLDRSIRVRSQSYQSRW